MNNTRELQYTVIQYRIKNVKHSLISISNKIMFMNFMLSVTMTFSKFTDFDEQPFVEISSKLHHHRMKFSSEKERNQTHNTHNVFSLKSQAGPSR